jgi:hypothetical protein
MTARVSLAMTFPSPWIGEDRGEGGWENCGLPFEGREISQLCEKSESIDVSSAINRGTYLQSLQEDKIR